MSAITQHTDIETGADENCSSVPEKKSFFAQPKETHALYGENTSTTAGNMGSIAPSSETNQRIKARNSFARRTQSLIASGLIAGITPTSTQKRSVQQTLDFALSPQDGADADGLKAGF